MKDGGAGKSQQVFPPESRFEESVASMFGLPEQALESATSVFNTDLVPEDSNPQAVPALDERRITLVPTACPFKSIFVRVEVALAGNTKMELGVIAVKVLEAETAELKVVVAEPLVISRLLNAEGLVMVPEKVCADVPFSVVVPELWVKVPEFE